MTGEAKQEEGLSKLPDVLVPAEAKTEVGVKDELKNVDMHRAAEQIFVPPLPLDSAKSLQAHRASAKNPRHMLLWRCCLSDKTKRICDGCLVQGHAR